MAMPIMNVGANPFELSAQEIAGRFGIAGLEGQNRLAVADLAGQYGLAERGLANQGSMNERASANQAALNLEQTRAGSSWTEQQARIAAALGLQREQQQFLGNTAEEQMAKAKLSLWQGADQNQKLRAMGMGARPFEEPEAVKKAMEDYQIRMAGAKSPEQKAKEEWELKKMKAEVLGMENLINTGGPSAVEEARLSTEMGVAIKNAPEESKLNTRANYADRFFRAGQGRIGASGIPLISSSFDQYLLNVKEEKDENQAYAYAKTMLSGLDKVAKEVAEKTSPLDQQKLNDLHQTYQTRLYDVLRNRARPIAFATLKTGVRPKDQPSWWSGRRAEGIKEAFAPQGNLGEQNRSLWW
jgi:hypothetical protein